MMHRKKDLQRPLLTLPQIIILFAVISALFIGLDLNQRARDGKLVGVDEETLQNEVNLEATRQVELQATFDYVQSDYFIIGFARGEGGDILPGEKRVSPLIIESGPPPTPAPVETPDPAVNAQPWQAWWQLLTDAPLPIAE